jgi:hypothetical protein
MFAPRSPGLHSQIKARLAERPSGHLDHVFTKLRRAEPFMVELLIGAVIVKSEQSNINLSNCSAGSVASLRIAASLAPSRLGLADKDLAPKH